MVLAQACAPGSALHGSRHPRRAAVRHNRLCSTCCDRAGNRVGKLWCIVLRKQAVPTTFQWVDDCLCHFLTGTESPAAGSTPSSPQPSPLPRTTGHPGNAIWSPRHRHNPGCAWAQNPRHRGWVTSHRPLHLCRQSGGCLHRLPALEAASGRRSA